MRSSTGAVLLFLLTTVFDQAGAQGPRPPFYYPMPRATAVRVTPNVRFVQSDSVTLSFSIYRPTVRTSRPAPVLLFYSLFWPEDGGSRRSDEWESWARVAAGNGIVAIMPELRGEPGTGNSSTPARIRGNDFERLITYLRAHAAEFNINMDRLAVYSASGAVASAFAAVEDPRQTAIKAAIMYYGSAEIETFRQDVPVLVVRAGLDHAGMNQSIDRMVARAIAQNAPITVLNHHGGHHGFEYLDDDAATRQIITQTLDFVKQATEPAYQAAIRAKRLDALAAAYLVGENYHQAALTYEELLRERPEDGRSRFPYAEALLADQQYSAACAQFSRMSGNFAVILPGTRACLLANTPDTAIALLRTIPKDWLTSEYVSGLRSDQVFQPLWGREDFKALFQ